MIAKSNRASIGGWWALALAILIACIIGWTARRAAAQISGASVLQADLDADNVLVLPAGRTNLEKPLVVKFGQTIRGHGWASQLVYSGDDPYAIVVGTEGKQCYGARLDSFRLTGGGVRVNRLDQTQRIRDVWIESAKSDGILIDGIGEQLPLDGVTVRECRGAGVHIVARYATNGVRLNGCNLQHNDGAGLLLETVAANAQLNDVRVTDCIIQGNQRGETSAEVVARGYVGRLRIAGGWIESGRKKRGLLAEPRKFTTIASVYPLALGDVTRRVGFLSLTDGAVVSECFPAMTLTDAYRADVGGANVWPDAAKVEWTGFEPVAPAGVGIRVQP